MFVKLQTSFVKATGATQEEAGEAVPFSLCSLTDKVPVFGTGDGGSIPSRGTACSVVPWTKCPDKGIDNSQTDQ